MKVYGGQRNHIKKKHKRQLKQQRWDAGQQINSRRSSHRQAQNRDQSHTA